MKKYIYFIIAFIIMCFVYVKVNAEEVVIPDSSIRVRVIANSNSLEDVDMKLKVCEYINKNLSVLLLNKNNIDEVREIINDNLNSINEGVDNLFRENNYDVDYNINFGDNYFPNKEYKGVKYKGGYYESLVITIGSGSGDNWWCCLFPPLCLLDGTDNMGENEYKLWVKELIDKYF